MRINILKINSLSTLRNPNEGHYLTLGHGSALESASTFYFPVYSSHIQLLNLQEFTSLHTLMLFTHYKPLLIPQSLTWLLHLS